MAHSTLILTKNERENLARCLDSLKDCDDVVVLDSGSEDGTQEVARDRGARLYSRDFDNFANQRNWAIDNVPFKHHWVLHLDADECVTPSLHKELSETTQANLHSAYLLANKLIFMGRWIRHSSMYPHYQARLLRLEEARFEQTGHGQHLAFAIRGSAHLHEPYLHYNFSKGIFDWVERHNRYSSDEARRLVRELETGRSRLKKVVSGSTAESRQQFKKRVADNLPFRPLMRFLYSYVWRCGFLDGAAGFHYCVLLAFYDYLTQLKREEFRRA